jgi:acetyl esterase
MTSFNLEQSARELTESIAQAPPLSGASLAEARKAAEAAQSAPLSMPDVDESWVTVSSAFGDFQVRIVRPQGSTGLLPAILYLHGGGWILGSWITHDLLTRRLAAGANAAVVFVEYSRAPQAQYPVQIEQCYAAAQWITEQGAGGGFDITRIAVAGDSAGGNLAAVMAHLARDNGNPKLAFQLLWYPTTAANLSLPSFSENADAPILNRDVIDAFLTWYIPGVDITDPTALPATMAPANASDFSGLAPAYIGTAEHDPLRDEGSHYAELLNAAGVPAELSNEPTLVHGYVSFALLIPAAAEATNRGLAALKAALHS